ncbi:hypothetical protein [Microbacterium sp.]|uniref:hypothetical protein n=1 Tax=Microbacterium sp. TaxID=51671 RepID=UPI002733ED24|nr:hypothetical protein [Microbacterium sp.]MDP3950887.1 hypothetical protein [Microbacterium sp.]
MTSDDANKDGITRRTAIGAAWAAPVIAMTIAAPMAAASVGTPEVAIDNVTTSVDEGVTLLNFDLLKTGGGLAAGASVQVLVEGFQLAPYAWGAAWDSAFGGDAGAVQTFTLLTDLDADANELFILRVVGTTPNWADSQIIVKDATGVVLLLRSPINPTP